MTPDEEQEHYTYLKLKQKQAMAMQGQQQTETAPEQSLPEAAQGAFQQVTQPIVSAAKAMHPKNLTGMLPMGGMMAGGAIGSALPIIGTGAGMSAGAGLGSIAQKMANMVYGTSGPVNPTTTIAGIPMAPKAAIDPMMNAAMAGVPETQEGQKVGQAIADTYQGAKPGIKKTLGQIGQMFTGKSANKVRRLINDPAAILPESLGGAKSVEDASKQYGEALANDKTSIFHEDGHVTRGITKTEFSPFSKGKHDADELAQSIWDKWKAGEPINAQEAFDAKRATDLTWPAVVKEGNSEQIRALSEFKTAMDDVMSSQGAGPFLKASKDYARARLGADFTQILPRTKTGDISTVKTLLLHALAPGRGVGMLGGGLTSPLVTGVGNLAAQGAMKGLNVVGRDPNMRQTLMGILQQIMQKRQSQQ